MDSQVTRVASAYWDNVKSDQFPRRYWQMPSCIRSINRRMGIDSDVWGAALLQRLKARPKAKSAVSIGCGAGGKELEYLKAGLVEHFDLFEISETRIGISKTLFAKAGLSDRATLRSDDGLAALDASKGYDLVFWDSALHHMSDVRAALKLSLKAINTGGVVVINEYVGPNRFQWTDGQMQAAAKVRAALPARFYDPRYGARLSVKRHQERPTIEAMIATDPTEAPDSESIIPAIRELVPSTHIWMLGGVIYHLALNDVLANFRVPEDQAVLDMAMVVDEALSMAGENHFAACIIER